MPKHHCKFGMWEIRHVVLLTARQCVQDLKRWVEVERSKRAVDIHPVLPAAEEALQCCPAAA